MVLEYKYIFSSSQVIIMGRKKRQPASKTRAATPLVIVSEPPVQARRASTPVQSGRRPRAPTPMPSGPRHFELRPAAAAVLSGTSKEPADLSNCPCDLIQSSTLVSNYYYCASIHIAKISNMRNWFPISIFVNCGMRWRADA